MGGGNAQIQVFRPHLVGPTDRNKEQAQWRSHAPKARRLQWAEKRAWSFRGETCSRTRIDLSASAGAQLLQLTRSSTFAQRCCLCPPAAPAVLGCLRWCQLWALLHIEVLRTYLKPRHKLGGCLHTPTQQPLSGWWAAASEASLRPLHDSKPENPGRGKLSMLEQHCPPEKMGTESHSLELGLRSGQQEWNRPYECIRK